MTALALTFLGSFQAAIDGEHITRFRSDKARALLAYLAVEAERPHSRASLCGLLWPDQSDDAALHNLSQTLLRLREALGDTRTSAAFLRISRQAIQWNAASDYRLDTADFVHLASRANADNLEQAAALYRGEFLPGFSLAGCTAFEEWLLLTRERFAHLALSALSTLTRARLAGGRYPEAAQHARHQLTLDPWREAAHRQLMRALAASGDRAAALAAYERCRHILHDDLGVEPDDETRALYEQLRTESSSVLSVQSFEVPAPQLIPPDSDLKPQKSHNLPEPLTPCIGRERELAELAALLHKPEVRLLTLVGIGGMGKTRLAQELGRASTTAFADGVFFVPLAPISAPAALAGAIATALGIALQGRDPQSVLFQMLRQKHLLLILDNFEQLLAQGTDAVDLIVDLIGAAPGVKLIVTSRERLKLRGEHVYVVQALTFSTTASLAEAAAAAAVRLFIQSVQRVQVGFQLTAANLAAVLRICDLVQGMPLGLELAAANAGGLPLGAIADAIEQSAEFLTVDWRDVPERQRSMRAVFAWSWQLLGAEERRILRQSAVFRGGFTYPAAQAVIGATPPRLTRLTDTSLLQWQATASGEGRYTMHEVLRQFAVEELNLAGERALAEEHHARYYLTYLAARGRRLGRGEPKEASSEIQTELDNIRLAWQWAAAHGLLAEIEQATYAWWQFCQYQGLEVEGRLNFAMAVDGVRRHLAQPEVDEASILLGQRLLAKLLALHANYLFAQGRDAGMAAQAREAVALGAACGGVEGETFGTFVLGRALQDLEQKREAGAMWQRTIQLVRLYGGEHPENELLHDAHWMAQSFLCGSALHFGDYHGSRSHMVQALQICQSLGKRWGELYCLASLAGIDFFLFDFAAAEAGFAATLPLARTLNYRRMEMVAQERLSGLVRLRGDYVRARTLLEQAVELAVELDFPYDEALFLAALVRLHCQLGDQAAAAQCHEQLTQLLARVKLPKECQLYAHLAAAVKAQYAGARQEALRSAEQAELVNQQGGDILFRLVDTALVVGQVRASVGQWEAATAAFGQALDAFGQFGNRALAAEPQAGLAEIALAQGDLAEARAWVEAILPVLAEQPHAGYNNPFSIYVICYRVLTAAGDSRATTVLGHGYELLQQDAAALDNDSRQRFLSDVPVHRNLLMAYVEMQAQAGKESRTAGEKQT